MRTKLADLRLLSYMQFGKGTVVRDIASEDTYKMFSSLLGWGTVQSW